MQQSSRPCARNNNIIPAAPVWQDAADNEEWSAWTDNTSADFAAAAEEQDDFGAWVDSSDPDDSFHFQTPMSSPYVSTEQFEETNVVTVRQLRRMNSLERDASVPGPVTTQTFSASPDSAVGLYNNPWDDSTPNIDGTPPDNRPEYSDDGDIDPEIDSALASSAWESVLVQDRISARSSDTEDDDEDKDKDDDGTFEAWNVEEQLGTDEASSDEQPISEARAQDIRDVHEPGILQQHHSASEGGLEWYKTDFNESKAARRSPPNWMQRLTGNRRKYEENARGR